MVRRAGRLRTLWTADPVSLLPRPIRDRVPAVTALIRDRMPEFRSPLRSTRVTSWLGIALAITFPVCFATGLVSHLIQHPPSWFDWPSAPTQLYRVTQGVHIATGIATVPILLAKLWSVYPKLFEWPPVRNLAHLLSRLSVFVLIGAALAQVTTGILNIARWYPPMPFFFTVAHHWLAWIAIGALLVHIAVQLPTVRTALARRPADPGEGAHPVHRRGVLGAVGAAVGVVTLVSVGQTFRPLSRLDLLAPRRPDIGPQHLTVNKSAVEAGVTRADDRYRLHIDGPRPRVLTLAELAALPHRTVALPIACVEGWSATGHWTGVPIRHLLALVGAPAGSRLRVESAQRGGLYRAATLPAAHCRDPRSLLALRLNGAELDLDHGYPCRVIAPNLPGVLQTKWVDRLVVLP
ncbi:molybdopterin-dependent oxidoreductase [Actinocatenispora sera]|uniref:Molybdopterin-binding protein n=1 Tax=Actinocatenispora sera TaxID=390989 RepID=A0A810LAQ0_9ACTN|nr:molybdopterin-dependent oxidoreductase [Actinocatenispora sera]BCJ32337.1 molybdopterin-binding protein [Actinocatenispora sera]